MTQPRKARERAQEPSGIPAHVRLYTPAEAGELLGEVSESHVYRLINEGELRAVDVARRGARKSKTRVRSDDLQAYIDEHTRCTQSGRRRRGGEAA